MSLEGDPPEFKPTGLRAPLTFDVDQIRSLVARHFKVYEVESDLRAGPGGEVAAFYVQADPAVFSQKFEELREAIRAHDSSLLVILQYKGGEDVILVARRPPVVNRGAGLNLVLLILTILTTTLAGAIFYSQYEAVADEWSMFGLDVTYLLPRYLALGFLSFSLPVMAILGIHELGHYFVAKRHHVRTSLPYFIPVPPFFLVGTFGAFISIREPIPDRKALFDIGAAGPIAGFIATLPVIVIGLLLTSVVHAPLPPEDALTSELFGPTGTAWGHGHNNSLAAYTNETFSRAGKRVYAETIFVADNATGFAPGSWRFVVSPLRLEKSTSVKMRVTYHVVGTFTPDQFVGDGKGNYSLEYEKKELDNETSQAEFAFLLPQNATSVTVRFEWTKPDPNVMSLGTSLLFLGMNYMIPTPDDVLIHPTGFAGWVGLLVTGFNLLPAGQLDGGHVARAVLGNNMKYASYATVFAMFIFSYFFTGWLVMAILIIFLGIRHPPPLNDKTLLDPRRKAMAVVVLLILVVSFIPVPFLTVD